MAISLCPFCNNDFPGSKTEPEYYILNSDQDDFLSDGELLYWVMCDECSACGPTELSQEDAIEAWNNRRSIRKIPIKIKE